MLTKSDLVKELVYRDIYNLDSLDIEDIYSSFRMLFIDGKTYAEAADLLAEMIGNGEFCMVTQRVSASESFF